MEHSSDRPTTPASPRSARRLDPWLLLANPFVWEATRIGLDLAFGLYRRRLKALADAGVLNGQSSLLDVGCGIGQYARVGVREYLGIDLEERYIAYARKRHSRQGVSFRCADVATLVDETKVFDTVLAVDLLHHLDDAAAVRLLHELARVARHHVVFFEPVTEQRGPVGRWIIEHDRGDHMRSLDELHAILVQAPLVVAEDRELRLGPITTRAILCAPETASE